MVVGYKGKKERMGSLVAEFIEGIREYVQGLQGSMLEEEWLGLEIMLRGRKDSASLAADFSYCVRLLVVIYYNKKGKVILDYSRLTLHNFLLETVL
jgi:hypothetical protein